jgi:hypothetical protein
VGAWCSAAHGGRCEGVASQWARASEDPSEASRNPLIGLWRNEHEDRHREHEERAGQDAGRRAHETHPGKHSGQALQDLPPAARRRSGGGSGRAPRGRSPTAQPLPAAGRGLSLDKANLQPNRTRRDTLLNV